MTTLKPLSEEKGKEKIYYDEILQVYGAEKIKPRGVHTPNEALEALKKHLNDKKVAKAKVVAKVNALSFKKKGVNNNFKLKEVPYEAVKSFYQFSDKPEFVVIGVVSKEIPKQYIVLAAPKANKLDRLFDVLQTSQLTPEHKLDKPVPPVIASLITVVGAESESSTSQSSSESRRSMSPPVLRNQPLEPPTETSRPISYQTDTPRSPSPQQQPSRTRTESKTSEISYASKLSMPPSISSHHQSVARPLSSFSSSSRSKTTPTLKRECSNQRTISLSRSSSCTIPAPQVSSSRATPSSIVVSHERSVEYNETKNQFVVYKPAKYRSTKGKSYEYGESVDRKLNYYNSSSSSDEEEDIKDRSAMKISEQSEHSSRNGKQKPRRRSDSENPQNNERLSSRIYYFCADRGEFSSSDSDSDSMTEDSYMVRRVSSRSQPKIAPSKRRNRSSSSSSSSSSSVSDDRESRTSSIYRIMRY